MTKVPLVSFLVVAAPMVVAIVYYFEIETGINGVEALPDGATTKEAFLVLEEKFAFGVASPSDILIEGDIQSPEVQGAIQRLTASIVADPRFTLPPYIDPSSSDRIVLMKLALPGHPTGDTAVDAIIALAGGIGPRGVLGSGCGSSDWRTERSGVRDLRGRRSDTHRSCSPSYLDSAFIVLLLVFRSIIIPIKAVIMNLLSVGTAYGVACFGIPKGRRRRICWDFNMLR